MKPCVGKSLTTVPVVTSKGSSGPAKFAGALPLWLIEANSSGLQPAAVAEDKVDVRHSEVLSEHSETLSQESE